MLLVLALLAATGDAPKLSIEDEGPRFEEFGGVPRLHAEISLLGAGNASLIPAAGGGLGVHLELGFTLSRGHIISARLSGATSGLFTSFQGGLSFAEHFGGRFSLGVGVTWGGLIAMEPRLSWLSFQSPIRFTIALDDSPQRRGFILGFEIAPGVAHNAGSRRARPPMPDAVLMAEVTLGWAVW